MKKNSYDLNVLMKEVEIKNIEEGKKIFSNFYLNIDLYNTFLEKFYSTLLVDRKAYFLLKSLFLILDSNYIKNLFEAIKKGEKYKENINLNFVKIPSLNFNQSISYASMEKEKIEKKYKEITNPILQELTLKTIDKLGRVVFLTGSGTFSKILREVELEENN